MPHAWAWGDIPFIAGSWVGINAALNLVTNLIARGILDPTKMERVALLNAASLAGLLLATEVLIAEELEAEAAVYMHEQYTAGLTGRFFPPVKRS